MKQMRISEAMSAFRDKVKPLVETSDKRAIKSLFTELTAAAGMQDGDEALRTMEHELRNALFEPNRRIRRNVFPRLYK